MDPMGFTLRSNGREWFLLQFASDSGYEKRTCCGEKWRFFYVALCWYRQIHVVVDGIPEASFHEKQSLSEITPQASKRCFKPRMFSMESPRNHSRPSWWFQPIPQIGVKIMKYLKPPPRRLYEGSNSWFVILCRALAGFVEPGYVAWNLVRVTS